ncbi:MAG: phage head spike fiber domain-containing protein [Candidatus Acidiferrales bacterium]
MTLQRRYGLSNFGPSIPPPLAFFGWKQTTPPNTQIIVDTSTAVYTYSSVAAGILFYKSPGAGQTNFWDVVNTLYAGNGVDLYKVVGPNQLVWSNTFTNLAWVNSGGNLLSFGQFDPLSGTNATRVFWNYTGSSNLSQTRALNYTPVTGNTFTYSIWVRLVGTAGNMTLSLIDQTGSAFASLVITPTATWTRYQVTGIAPVSSTQVGVLIGNVTNTASTVDIYGAQLEVGGPATPAQLTTAQPQGVYLWGIVAPTATPTISSNSVSSTWQASTAYTLGSAITDSNGNLQICTTAGTSGSTHPTWATTFASTTADGATLVWTESGPNALSPQIGYQWLYAFLNNSTGHPSNVSPLSANTTTLANNLGVTYTIKGVGSTDPQVNMIALYRNTDGGPFFFQVATFANPAGGGTWTYVDSTLDVNLSSIYAPVGLLNSPPPAGAVNPIWHGGRMWVSVGATLYYSTSVDNAALLNINQNGVVAESWFPLNTDPLDEPIIRSWSTSAGLLVETTSDVWLVSGNNLSNFDPVKVLKGHGSLSYNASDMDGGTLWMYTSDRQFLSASSSAGSLEVGFPVGDVLQVNVDPAKAYVARHVSGSKDNALFLGDGVAGWYRCNPNQVGASVSGEQTVVWSPYAAITNGLGAIASIETTPGVKQLLVGAQGVGGSVQVLGQLAGAGANFGSGAAWTNPSYLTLNNPATPATVELNIQTPGTGSGTDVSGKNTGSGTSVTSGSVTTGHNNELAISVLAGFNSTLTGAIGNTTVTPGSGWASDSQDTQTYKIVTDPHFAERDYFIVFGTEHKLVASAGAVNAPFTLSDSSTWECAIATFVAGSGVAPTIVQQQSPFSSDLAGVTSAGTTLSSLVTKGNYLVVAAITDGAASALTASDSLGNLFTSVLVGTNVAIFLAPISVGGTDRVTVTSSSTVHVIEMTIYELTLPVSGGGGTPNSQFLQATNFSLGVPIGAIPLGVKVYVTGSQTSSNPDAQVTLSWISPVGSAPSYNFQLPSTSGTVSFGGSVSTWGQTLTPSLLNNSGFGFQLQANVVTTSNITFKITSVQVQVFYLLVSPILSPVMFRDLTTFADVGSNFTWSATIGSLVLASEGTLAEVESVSIMVRAANGIIPGVAVILDEIAGAFESLPLSNTEPPQLAASSSVLANRYYLSQGTAAPICTHMQVQLTGGATNTRDELLRLTVRGELVPEQE